MRVLCRVDAPALPISGGLNELGDGLRAHALAGTVLARTGVPITDLGLSVGGIHELDHDRTDPTVSAYLAITSEVKEEFNACCLIDRSELDW